MRYAIFSDIHGNLPAWNAVLADMRALETDVYVCLGDIVGYGPRPQEVLDGIRAVTANFVLGNHDAAAAGVLDASIFNDQAREVIEWTRDRLNPESIQFFKEMPLAIEDEEILFVHAEIEEPGRFLYIDSEEEAEQNFAAGDQPLTFVGHTHNPGMFVRNPDGNVHRLGDRDGTLRNDRRYIVNVGSVGEPRNPEDIRARYVVYDSDTRTVAFRRIEFDVETYRSHLQQSGLHITPYFLTVVDHYQEALAQSQAAGAGHAMMVDMKTPAIRPVTAGGGRRKLVVPGPGTLKDRPKPRLTAAPKKRSPAVAAILVSCLLAAVAGIAFWLNQGDDKGQETLVLEDSDRVLQPGEKPVAPAAENPAVAGGSIESMIASELGGKPPAPETVGKTIGHWQLDRPSEPVEGVPLKAIEPGGTKAPPGNAWQVTEIGGQFDLRPDRSFTFECWFLAGPPEQKEEFVVGNRSDGGENFRGWHLIRGKGRGDAFQFAHDSGQPGGWIELAIPDDGFFDELPHHLAVVWNHAGGTRSGEGLATVFVDGRDMGDVKIPHDRIPEKETAKKFCIGDRLTKDDNRFRGELAEARFSEGALPPTQFLTESKPMPEPEPEPKPTPPKPKPEPVPPPPPPPPKPPTDPPYEVTDVAGLGKGLVFYAPFDEPAEAKWAWDFSGNGRHLPLWTVVPGEEGKIGSALRVEKKTIVSPKQGLPQLEKSTISFWIRQNDEKPNDTAGNLLSFQNVLSTKLKGLAVDANLDLAGRAARVNLPKEPKWVHVFIENKGAKTEISLNRGKPGGSGEKLKKLGTVETGLAIGSANGHFSLDEVAIWNRALTDVEKREVFLRGAAGSPILSPAKVVAHWKFDESQDAQIFEDSAGKTPLGTYAIWGREKPVAPNPLPLTLEENTAAARIRLLGEKPDGAGAFALTREAPFTFEGWFHPGRQKIGTLGGTLVDAEGAPAGWRVALAHDEGNKGFIAFMYGNDAARFQALGKNLKIYDDKPHHFAAVWDPAAGGDEKSGILSLFIDNKKVATESLPHSEIVADAAKASPFQVGNNQTEITVDELRFSASALHPGLFLTAGRNPAPPPPKKPADPKAAGKAKQ